MTIAKLIPEGVKKRIKMYLHKGDTYLCPLCGYASKDHALIGLNIPLMQEKQIVGAGQRRVGCFKCASTDRERLIYIYLREMTDFFTKSEHKSVLHIAPEPQLSEKLLKVGFQQYVCGDLFTEGYEYPAYVQNMSVLDLPMKANTFDLILCNHVLEHVPDDGLAMREIFRVLKPGGKAVLQVPISMNSEKTLEDPNITTPSDRERHYGQFDHVRLYGQDYVQRLEAAGFSVERLNISKQFARFGLNPKEELYVGMKAY